MQSILKVLLVSFFAFSTIIPNAIGQKKKQKPAKNNKEHSLLWEISGKDLAKPSYLFGTIHMICKEDFFFEKHFEEALNKTAQLCLEIDMSDEMAMMSAVMMMMDMSGTKTLSSYFTEAEQVQIDKFLQEKAQIGLAQANNFKPIFLVSLLATESFDCPPAESESYETFLEGKAKEKSMKLLGIETVAAQIEALSSLDDSVTISYIKSYFDENPNNKERKNMQQQGKDLIKLYKQQNIYSLYDLVKKQEKDANMNMNALLNDRNEDWIPKMMNFMKEKPTFFAFGAAHLAGDKGVIALLKQAGYVVKPVLEQ